MGRALLGQSSESGGRTGLGWVSSVQAAAHPVHSPGTWRRWEPPAAAWKPLFPELSGEAGRPNSRSPLFASPEPEHLGNRAIRQSGVQEHVQHGCDVASTLKASVLRSQEEQGEPRPKQGPQGHPGL